MGNRRGPGRSQVPSGWQPVGQLKPLPKDLVPAEGDDREARIQKAANAFRAGVFSKMAAAQHHYGLTNAEYQTMRHRIQGTHRPAAKAQAARQILSEVQEKRLVDWCSYLGPTGHPLNRRTTGYMVKHLLGPHARHPGRKWFRNFLKRNEQDLRYTKATGLESKRAKGFNPTAVHEHFEKLEKLIREKGVKWKNVYNMDEKGIQLGGGRKNNGMKYLFSRLDRARYSIQDGNLELVTIIECVCADGSNLKPTFIFAGKNQVDAEWIEVDDAIQYATASIIIRHKLDLQRCSASISPRTDGQTTSYARSGSRTASSLKLEPTQTSRASPSF